MLKNLQGGESESRKNSTRTQSENPDVVKSSNKNSLHNEYGTENFRYNSNEKTRQRFLERNKQKQQNHLYKMGG